MYSDAGIIISAIIMISGLAEYYIDLLEEADEESEEDDWNEEEDDWEE